MVFQSSLLLLILAFPASLFIIHPVQKVITSAEMREIDRLTTERFYVPSIILMESAAEAAAREIALRFNNNLEGKSALVLCGPGNNGGDGAALARKLSLMGAGVSVVLFGRVEDLKG